ncbi:MAG: hypothetical protein A2275_14025 [Bacteroidetes bacterium RIFOXYA12_FULL_35_11]|nr:MAG: hypothetical protein A2X01_03500 [Bacteroidetes bacterium GWF2_35_48]OFY73529.1 MAG: hypothetical protein A2275_14025 [Bacteroidetes bacterium RIFOXYA12_FULL_35_11]OFY96690.1 MAG: hypothetical protein A2491_09180 [Bacteroidetes bacterium RIFOXYC12_FULL_35_7]
MPANRKFRYFILGAIAVFATIGFVLTGAFLAVKLHLTNDPGAVDYNDRIFQELANKKYKQDSLRLKNATDSAYVTTREKAYIYYKIMALNEYYPLNASLLLNAFEKTKDPERVEQMFDALMLRIDTLEGLKKKFQFAVKILERQPPKEQVNRNAFEWMNFEEWDVFKEAVVKDKQQIDSAAQVLGLDSRLIVSVLVGEQIRLFTSIRETYKNVIAPLKILSVENKFSYGVTGVKQETAMKVEDNLKNKNSEFYLGEEFVHLLDFQTGDREGERFNRLVNYRNHYYSYLYAGIILKQHIAQWQKAGHDISDRPEIIATLFNLGFHASKPKPNPSVGGANINVNGVVYTFGALAYEFYYSGELIEAFPFPEKKKTK